MTSESPEDGSRDQELAEAQEQLRATSEVLKVISRSSFELEPVLQTIVERATRLCGADQGFIFRRDGDTYRLAVAYQVSAAFTAWRQDLAAHPGDGSIVGRVALLQRTVQILDAQDDREWLEMHRDARGVGDVRTLLGVPMMREGIAIGVIAVWRTAVQPFTGRQVELVTTFADQAVIAVENVRLFRELESRNADLAEALEQQVATGEMLRTISRSPTDTLPVFEMIARSAVRLCDGQFSGVFRFDGDLLHLVAFHNLTSRGAEVYRRALPRPAGRETVIGRVILDRAIVHVPDALADPEYGLKELARTAGIRSIIGVPMMRDGKPIGGFVVWRSRPGLFDASEIALLSTFADQAVIAVENVRLFQELQARNRDLTEALEQQTATTEVLKAIGSATFDLRAILHTVVQKAAALCGAQHALFYRIDSDGLRPEAWHNVREEYIAFRTASPIRLAMNTLMGRVALTRGPVHVHDVLAEPTFTSTAAQQLGEWRTVLGVPVLCSDEPIGAIAVFRREVRPFTAKQVELVSTFADQAAIAIGNARLFRELEIRNAEVTEALEQQTATAEILRAISRSPTDALPVFETIVRNAVALCGSLFANVFRYDGELLHYLASHNTGPGYDDLLRSKYPMRPDRSQVSGRVILGGAVVRVEDARADPDYDQRFPTAIGWRRMLGVPLLREDRVLGVIVVGWAESGPVPKAQGELLKTFADQAVIAIENVRLFEEIQSKSRQLELANTYKSRFLSAASHDLRQPLHALNLFVSQLRAEPDPTERSRLIERIDSAIGGMNELFDALLDMSKIEAGILDRNLTEFPVERLLARMETTFAGAAREKGLRLRVVPSGAWIRSDFVLLERVLLNLVSNAVRYTVNGGIVIGCRRRGHRLRIDVRDSGIGIPEAHQQNVFREFYQVAGPEPGRRGGLGLGLAIVDRLSGLLEHPVEVESHPGRGSRFSVWVPVVAERPESAAPPSVALPAIPDPAAGRLIVVIDDDALVLDGMRGLLRSWGCQVVAEATEVAALERLAELARQPDLIISDYRLADGQTGIDAIARLREALGISIPAFLVSGDTAPERLRDAGASGFHLLHKPVSPMALRALLNRLLMARGDAGETSRS